MKAHSLSGSSVRRGPEPVQDFAPPWAPDSRPLPGPDSSWTEPGPRRGERRWLSKGMRRTG